MALSLFRQRFIFGSSQLFSRRIMTSSAKLQKAVEQLQENPYFDKYAEKIAALQKSSPEEFMERIEKQTKEKKPKIGSVDTRQYSSVLNPKSKLQDLAIVQDKKLEDIFKIELVQDKDASEIRLIWEEYHKVKDVISATILNEAYEELKENIKKFPVFILPLPRSQGYEFIMCQTAGNSVHFTPLLAYQVHKENAPECLTMVHYTELSDKGLVLMRGEFDKNVIDGKEAQCLANQFQLYYGKGSPQKKDLLQKFTKAPDSFNHMDLVAELENLTIG